MQVQKQQTMKKLTTSLLLIITSATFGQAVKQTDTETRGHLITLTYSNNGQIYDVIDEFYFSQGAYLPNNDVFTYKQNDLKFNFHYEYLSRSKFSFFGKMGYSNRKDTYTISNMTSANGSKDQHYFNFSLGAKYNYQLDKFLFSTGIEIPYYKISTYTEKLFWESPSQVIHDHQAIDGGEAYGLNSISSLKFFICDRIFLSTEISFGLLIFDLGGQINYVVDYQDPVISTSTYEPRDDSYNRKTVTKPEFYFGIGVKL
jgi:hypothetical protein